MRPEEKLRHREGNGLRQGEAQEKELEMPGESPTGGL